MNEIVPVIGFENEYMISDDGVVFRKTERGLRKMKPHEDKDGYYKVILSKSNQRNTVFVHRLVAEAYIPNGEMLPCVNHKDENKQNNCVENLEWCTVRYNNTYNRISERRGEKRRKPIIAIGKGKILYFESIKQAGEHLNISPCNISSCLTGRRKAAGGMRFCYLKG